MNEKQREFVNRKSDATAMQWMGVLFCAPARNLDDSTGNQFSILNLVTMKMMMAHSNEVSTNLSTLPMDSNGEVVTPEKSC